MEYRTCPNCLGPLVKATTKSYDYDCSRCGRGWKVLPNGDWKERFATGGVLYPKDSVEAAQRENPRPIRDSWWVRHQFAMQTLLWKIRHPIRALKRYRQIRHRHAEYRKRKGVA